MDKIKFAKLHKDAIIPSKREGDGCYDLYACLPEPMFLEVGKIALIPTGLCSSFSPEYRISLRERGSNTKTKLAIMSGQIDSNYRGGWFVAVRNVNDKPVWIANQDWIDAIEKSDNNQTDTIKISTKKAICQFAVERVPQVEIEEVHLDIIQGDETERGTGCLGSSGK